MEVSSNASKMQNSQVLAPVAPAASDPAALFHEAESFTGVSTYITQLKEFVSTQITQTGPLLLIGERGLRHEQIAGCIHQASGKLPDTFQHLNLPMYSAEALHELLFSAQGLLVAQTDGTVFFDDLSALPQALLRRFALLLEEQRWQTKRLGARLICGAFEEIGTAGLRETLAYGLEETLRPSAFRLKPLRERSEDIPDLAKLCARRSARRLERGEVSISPETLAALTAYDWWENIDELEAALESAIRQIPPTTIEEVQLPTRIRTASLRRIPPSGFSLKNTVEEFERSLITTALQQTGGVQTRAAKLLGLRIQTLNMKLKRFGESPDNDSR